MRRFKRLMLCAVMMAAVGCGSFNRLLRDDPFYSSIGEWDSLRLPLIQPYEAIDGSNGMGWVINLASDFDSELTGGAIVHVQSLAVQKRMVMVQARGLWYTLVPDERLERAFSTREGLYAFVANWGIDEPRWGTPDEFYTQFRDTGCLDWIPDCQ